MPLGTFDDLKAATVEYVGRNDLSGELNSMVAIVESRMYANNGAQVNNFKSAPLRIKDMETRSTVALGTSDRYLALPSDMLQMRRFRLYITGESTDTDDLTMVTPEQLCINPVSGKPRQFTVTSQVEFDRVPDQAYTSDIQYFGKIAALSDSNTTNAVLTNYPDIYLFGMLYMAYRWADEPALAGEYYNDFIQAIIGANIENSLR